MKTAIMIGVAIAAFGLAGCKEGEPKAPSAVAKVTAKSHLEMLSQSAGFTTGTDMNNPVIVFFDPLCPHCGKLWSEMKDSPIRIKWVPVAVLSPISQYHAQNLLKAKDVEAFKEAMTQHEKILANDPQSLMKNYKITPDDKVNKNVQLYSSLGTNYVPAIVTSTANGGYALKTGSLTKAQFEAFVKGGTN